MGIGTGIGIRRSHRLELLLGLGLVHLLRLGRCERREHRLLPVRVRVKVRVRLGLGLG